MVSKITCLFVAVSVMVLFVQGQPFDTKGFLPQLVFIEQQVATDCKANEYYTTCGSGCGDQRCSALYPTGVKYFCAAVCKVGCFCVPGTARNTTGSCVPINECA